MDNKVPEDMIEVDRLVRKAVLEIGEHVDAVSVFASKRRDDGKSGTWNMCLGSGNWFARYGQVQSWLIEEEDGFKCGGHSEDEKDSD